MSAGIDRRVAATRLGRWWQGWRFHLNAVLMVIPLLALPGAWHDARTVSGQLAPPQSWETFLTTGPFALHLSEIAQPAPDRRTLQLVLCPGCEQRIREVRVSAGTDAPANPEDDTIFLGPPARMQATLPRSRAPLWLTVVEWNGTRYTARVPEGVQPDLEP